MMAETALTQPSAPHEQEPLPFPFNQRPFCRYEPIEKKVEAIRVLIVDNLLRDENDLSKVAWQEWSKTQAGIEVRRERHIAGMAMENIKRNVQRLVRQPEMEVVHLAETTRPLRSPG